jgi:hypothetical protein
MILYNEMKRIKENFHNNLFARYLLECNNYMDIDSCCDFFNEYITDYENSDMSMIID